MKQKYCKRCGVLISGARNLQFCPACTQKYIPRHSSRLSKYRFDRSTLEDREFRSYFLGFLCTDGSAQATKKGRFRQVGWYSSEKDHVQRITDRLQYEGPVYPVSSKGAGEWGNSFWADNARLIQDMGLKVDKEDHSLRDMDVDLYPFLRGHLDGDGTVRLRRCSVGRLVENVSFLARVKLAGEISERLKIEGYSTEPVRERQDTPVFAVRIESTMAEKLLSQIYDGATIYLPRKYDLWEEGKVTRMDNPARADALFHL